MKVNNNNDSVELSHASRSQRGDKAAAANRAKAAAENSEPAAAGATSLAAGVELSGEAKAMHTASQIAKADTSDQAKIDRIKAMISSGTYKPDFGKVADNVINETLLQDIS